MSPPSKDPPEHEFDVFVSHATEDKTYVIPLVLDLETAGVRVWFDSQRIGWGDDLRESIDRGLTNCTYGIVVFSPAFLRKKKWTEYELNGLFAREQVGKRLILPIWHGITRADLIDYSPAFADRVAKNSSSDSRADIVESVLNMLGRADPKREDKPPHGNLAPPLTDSQVANESEAELRAAAHTGDKTAQNRLGDFYRDVQHDPEKALAWYRRSAEQGFAAAQTNIGHLYYSGEGVSRDYKQAMDWFISAAAQGFAPAQFNIGNLYGEGAGVTKDYVQARHWWRKAADQGDSSAQYNMGLLYQHGYGVNKDYEQAMAWLHKALGQGDKDAFNAIRTLRRQIAAEESFVGSPHATVSPDAMALIHDILPQIMKTHKSGDWGKITIDQELLNMRALKNRDWVFSEYPLRGAVVIVQTDGPRESTDVHLKGEEGGPASG
jgi:hypothetical protein